MQYKLEEIQNDQNILIAHIIGSFTFRDHDTFFEIVKKIQSEKYSNVIFDLIECDFIDSAGLGMLIIANDEALMHHTELLLRNPIHRVKDVFWAARFDSIFNIEIDGKRIKKK